jgi:type IV secretory pathway TrbL component
MDIIHILIVIFVAGALLWLANKAPIQDSFKQIFNGVAVVALVVWLLIQFLPYLHAHF